MSSNVEGLLGKRLLDSQKILEIQARGEERQKDERARAAEEKDE